MWLIAFAVAFFKKETVVVIATNACSNGAMYDNDNIEVSAIINALKINVLSDDNPFKFSVMRIGRVTEIPSTDIYLMPKEHFMQWYNENGFTVNDREKHERILKEVKKRGKALLKNTELNLKTGRIIKYANQKNVKKHS